MSPSRWWYNTTYSGVPLSMVQRSVFDSIGVYQALDTVRVKPKIEIKVCCFSAMRVPFKNKNNGRLRDESGLGFFQYAHQSYLFSFWKAEDTIAKTKTDNAIAKQMIKDKQPSTTHNTEHYRLDNTHRFLVGFVLLDI